MLVFQRAFAAMSFFPSEMPLSPFMIVHFPAVTTIAPSFKGLAVHVGIVVGDSHPELLASWAVAARASVPLPSTNRPALGKVFKGRSKHVEAN